MDAHDAITFARRSLFEAGGIHIKRFGSKGRMVPIAPEFQDRADAYNALAELHLRFPDSAERPTRADFGRIADLHAGA